MTQDLLNHCQDHFIMFAARQVYSMLGNESLWQTAVLCNQQFREAQIAHSICGGVAVCLHGYQRNTTDLDLIVYSEDTPRIKELLQNAGLQWHESAKEFRTASGIAVQFLLSGDRAGKGSEVTVPAPAGELNVEEREGLTVVKLSRLIEMKLASGSGSLRRTHKDFADVVELIAIRQLDSSFARYLHASLRQTFRDLVRSAQAD